MSITPNVLATRYATKEMVAIFDPVNKIINERKFWITILRLQQKSGLPITESDIKAYEQVVEKVDLASIDKREMKTRHDVKAVEYFVRDRLTKLGREDLLELTHFACTSEDVNNLSYAITIHDAITDVWLPKAKSLTATPSRSLSGSVPTTISAFDFSAKAKAIASIVVSSSGNTSNVFLQASMISFQRFATCKAVISAA